MTGYNFAQRNFVICEGQILAISDNQALFALLGTRYGGDGRTTFGLPDMRTDKVWNINKPIYQICLDGIFPSRH